MRAFSVALLSVLFFVLGAQADPPVKLKLSDEEVKMADKAVKEHLAKVRVAGGNVAVIGDEPVVRAFQDSVFVAVTFRQFPVAIALPEGSGLGAQNVFVFKNGKLEQLKDGLEKYFKSALGEVKNDMQAKTAAEAWLVLAQVFHNDGAYKFQLDKDVKVTEEKGQRKASGKFTVAAGGSGEYVVALSFSDAGKLAKVEEKGALRPGPRPICQATLLLDADPAVRRMAEQDLLVMGRFARDYLVERRAEARPELQQAIDRLWNRIDTGATAELRYVGQAALLTHGNALVRRIAEHDLIVLGRSAVPHLKAARSDADAGLRQAIDRVLERIAR